MSRVGAMDAAPEPLRLTCGHEASNDAGRELASGDRNSKRLGRFLWRAVDARLGSV